MIAVGGELTLDALALRYNEQSGVYRAPIQMLANGGVLLVDEFGRQRCPPRDRFCTERPRRPRGMDSQRASVAASLDVAHQRGGDGGGVSDGGK